MLAHSIPVLTIDGPSGVGKGSVSLKLAKLLGWHILDSGAIYRLLALAATDAGIELDRTELLCELADNFQQEISFQVMADEELPRVYYNGMDVSERIRTEVVGSHASQLATQAAVREKLLQAQRAFQKSPGLIADGRDMGTVVFPTARVKFFLTASVDARTKRRHKQLKEKEKDGSIQDLLRAIIARDRRDAARKSAPMKAALDAIVLDTTAMSLDEVVVFIAKRVADRLQY